ncbi:S41 family peptidase, partial [Winogradskyella sp.]|uniref:S41 family peptidase n=1 Tax=Winogradskyella sp. TaxID=1883156 RepID=UPI002639C91F
FYNENLQDNNTNFLFTNSIEGVGAINSLNLSKVYVLTTNRRTASASELVINSLKAYLNDNVIVIGENTVGKTQASITIYDSPTLAFENVNPNHTYAMQPLIANSTNANDELVPPDGLAPDILLTEVRYNLGTLGNPEEPLLAEAIEDILGAGRSFNNQNGTINFHLIEEDGQIHPLEQEMYIEK